MPGIAREFQNVPHGDAHVLEHLPGGVRKSFDSLAAFIDWKIFYEITERDVSIAVIQQRRQMLAKCLVSRGVLHVFHFSLSLWEKAGDDGLRAIAPRPHPNPLPEGEGTTS